MTAEEYLAIDDTLETGQAVEDDDILCLVNRDDVPDAAHDDDDNDAADDDDDTKLTEVTNTQAREMITRLIPYFEQATQQTTFGWTAGECGLPRPTLGYGRRDTETIHHPQQADDDCLLL